MKKGIMFTIVIGFCLSVYSISIADFTVQYAKNGRFYNFYDNPAELFDILGEENTLEEIGIGYSEEYNYEDCFFSILSREFGNGTVSISPGTLDQIEREFLVKNPNSYYSINYFEGYKDFSTIRGISIGSEVSEVLSKYSEAVIYKKDGKYKWKISDCYRKEKIKKVKNKTDIGYVLIESANWQYNRSWEADCPMHYELVFIIKDSKVKSIVMQYVLDAM